MSGHQVAFFPKFPSWGNSMPVLLRVTWTHLLTQIVIMNAINSQMMPTDRKMESFADEEACHD
jgi:hypothetical protein